MLSFCIQLFILAFCTRQSAQQDSLSTSTISEDDITSYEFIVIGSGPGGGPLAVNLARAGHTVLMLEAGEDHGDSPLQRVPSMADTASEDPTMSWSFFVSHYSNTTQAYRDSKYTWRYPNGTLHVGACDTLPDDSNAEPLGILYPRAGTLGGCAQHDAMNFALPPDRDWDFIANLTDDESWSAENMRSIFASIESNQYVLSDSVAAEGHGFHGWLASNQNDIELLRPQNGLREIIRNAYTLQGYDTPTTTEETFALMQHDINRIASDRYERNDVFQPVCHMDGLRRRSSAQTYIRDTVYATNDDGSPLYPGLTVSTSSLANRILFKEGGDDDADRRSRAVGVEYMQGQALYRADSRNNGLQVGELMRARATREVIVAGGVFNTPQILKLSGIGPREELESFDIPVVVDLPAVGQNMQDNYEGGVVVRASAPFESVFTNCTSLAPGDPCLKQWEEDATGAYSQCAAPVAMLRRSTMAETPDADLFYFGAAGAVFRGHFPGYSQYHAPPTDLFWSTVKMQPRNRAGTVTLRSADPQDTPIIDFNFFEEGGYEDIQALVEGVGWARELLNMSSPPYAPFANLEPRDDVGIEQGLRDEVFSHHATSTCSMGPVGDIKTCVDSQFRVQGVDGLRVVDGSVFPRVPGAFPVLPTFLISQKASIVILQTIGKSPL